jgi:hypothetical protein
MSAASPTPPPDPTPLEDHLAIEQRQRLSMLVGELSVAVEDLERSMRGHLDPTGRVLALFVRWALLFFHHHEPRRS